MSSSSVPTPGSSLSTKSKPEHPLENDVILRTIFQYCPTTFESVRTLRLVKKAWKHAAEPQWKSLTLPVTILQDENAQQQGDLLEGRTTLLTQFMQQQSDSRRSSRNLELKNWTILNNHFTRTENGDVDWNKRFWNVHAPIVAALTLNGCTLPWSYCFFEDAYFEALPNVETLSLLDCKIAAFSASDRRIQREHVCLHRRNQELRHPIASSSGEVHHIPHFVNKNVYYPHFKERLVMKFDHLVLSPQSPQQWSLIQANEESGDEESFPQGFQNFQEDQNPRLVSLRIKNLQCAGSKSRINWSALFRRLPNLQAFSVEFQTSRIDELFDKLQNVFEGRKWKKLDIIKAYDTAAEMCTQKVLNLAWQSVALEKLTLDCGLDSPSTDILKILRTQAATLRELHLFRAPFSEPYSSFPCDVEMPNLTELRLLGNVSSNLDFLKLMPSLKILALNSSCYDHDSRIQKFLKSGTMKPSCYKNIVENTNGLGAEFKLDSITTLEMELGQVTLNCYQKLGGWMPNLKNLKGTVVGEEQFAIIGELWHEIENLELLHGSAVSANGILDVLVRKGLYKSLKSFIWRHCPCPRTTADLQEEEMFAENELRRLAGRNVVIPWKGFRLTKGQGQESGVCQRDAFERGMSNV